MNDETLLPLLAAAARLGVSGPWLRKEAEAGRLPCLRAGNRLLFHIPTVEKILVDLAMATRPPEKSEVCHAR